MNEDERVAAQQRDKLRADRKRDRERELRLENMKGNFKKQKMDRERDISEKIALGQLKVSKTVYHMQRDVVYTVHC
jgi:SNW domain-containing protein 1